MRVRISTLEQQFGDIAETKLVVKTPNTAGSREHITTAMMPAKGRTSTTLNSGGQLEAAVRDIGRGARVTASAAGGGGQRRWWG